MTVEQQYYFFKSRKYTLPLSKAEQVEKADALEQRYYQHALTEKKQQVVELRYAPTRRNAIFRAFPAGEYANPVTRLSIVVALANCNTRIT